MTRDITIDFPKEILQVTGSVNGVAVPWERRGDAWTAVCDKSPDKTYNIQIKAVDSLGGEHDYSLTLHDGLALITDRTQADVNKVVRLAKKWSDGTITETEKVEWFTDLKGSYNASDLNRVGTAMEYISQRLATAGYGHALKPETDWKMSDFHNTVNTSYYLDSLRLLRSWFVTWKNTPKTPDSLDKLDYKEANAIEQILVDIDDLITKMQQNYVYSGEIYAGEV